METEKFHLNNLSIILGTQCNMNCKHCMGGNIKQHIELDIRCIENIIPDIYGIDILQFIGYETTLYIDKMKQVFDLLIQHNIQINKIKVNTNGKTFSQELVDFMKYSKDYIKYPKKSSFLISVDKFHFTDENVKRKILANIEKYKKELFDICYIEELNLKAGLLLVGNAKQLTKEETQDIDNIYTYSTNVVNSLEIRNECKGINNICQNGKCVRNCIVSPIILTPNGYIFIESEIRAFNALADGNYNNAIGNILNLSFRTIINSVPNRKKANNWIIIKNAKDLLWKMEYRLFKVTYFKEQLIENFYNKNVRKHYELWEEFDDYRKPLRWSDGLNTVPEMTVFIHIKEIFLKTIELCLMIDTVMKAATIKGIPHYEEFCNIFENVNDNCIQEIERLWGNYQAWYNKWVSYENWEIDDIIQYSELLMQEMKS